MGVICTSSSSKVKKNESNEKDNVEKPNPKPLEKESTKPDKTELKTTDTDPKKNSSCNTLVTNTDQKQMAVSIDCNVFISRGALNPDDIYIKEKILGKGSYGVVYLVKHKQLHRY